ncbi:M23 family metallopeptidase [Hydrogenovibrio marinus]|uniref:M23ase beta-sheet core domain-containing protein n=1 Tax=Hydrogenovibrio marinus TaxID=28885 RepID=A0A066ZP58_HYDMR|nr:M23 family metallopeptidase [Hydrogenovibrio marinus]KDN95277.1 hypothetical protein EI16_02935 [Hydrogenovibrio marinus]BBN59755.1 peptidase M23 [Hydrogenovibrio marinus]
MDVVLPYLFALYPLLLAAAATFWICGAHRHNWANWIALLLATSSVMLFVYLTSPWAFSSYYLRYFVVAVFAVAVAYSYLKMILGISEVEPDTINTKVVSLASIVVFLMFMALSIIAILSRYPADNTLNIDFPLKSGRYYVLQGGNSFVTNPFHTIGGADKAMDIVKLNVLGNRASGLAPSDLNDYNIYGETVYSPCSGKVVSVHNDVADNEPMHPNPSMPEGNSVVIKCDSGEVLLAHLKQGSIQVTPKQLVLDGDPIAQVGNSGNSLEPHLHMSASKDGKSMGISFNGFPLSINSVISR